MRLSSLPAFFLFALLAFSTAIPSKMTLAAENLGAFTGTWVDSENEATRMVIVEEDGLLRIAGGDEQSGYAYTAACLVTGNKAACMGDGGKLEGENFLYESVIELGDDGNAVESWKAFNNLQAAEGNTIWTRSE